MSGSPSLSLRELIDIDELQSIQDSFARAVGISSVILSPEGEPLTKFTNPTGFCSLIQSTEKGKERCFRSFMEMGKNALLSKELEIFYCFARGGHFVAPIMIDGEHKGTMFAGQFIPEKFSSEQLHDLEEIAHEIGIDQRTLVKEAEKIRVVGEDVVRNYSSLLFKIVETIVKRGAQAAELSRVNDALQVARDGLEKRVQERTAELAEANKGLEHEITERKLADEELRLNAAMMDNVTEGVYLIGLDDLLIKWTNEKFAGMFGYGPREVVGKHVDIVNAPTEKTPAETRIAIVDVLKETGEWHGEVRNIKRDGTHFWCSANVSLFDHPEYGRVMVSAHTDITERKQAEETLRESEEKFRLIAENSIDCIWLLDTRLRFTYLSPSAERILGYKPEQMVGTKLSSHFKKKEFLKIGILTAKTLKNYKTFTHVTFETKMLNSKNDEVDIEISSNVLLNSQGKLIGLQGTTRDITERKKAKEAFTDETIRRRILMEQSRDGIVILDRNGNVYESNQRFAEMLGYSPGEVSHLHVWDWELQRTREQLRDMLRNIDETGNNFETQHRRKDGTVYDVEISANGAVFAGEKLIFYVCRDITERKRIEKALKDRVEFEEIVATISTSFINFAPDELDAGIEDALRSIGEFSGVDRSYIFRLFDDGTTMDNTHKWRARGIVPQIGNLKGLQTADFPWSMERLNRFETVHIPSVANLPPEAGTEKEELQSEGLLSVIFVPMVSGRTLFGFIGLDSVRQAKSWSEENIALLRMVGEIFVNALEHRHVLDALQSSETKFHAIFEENPLGAVIVDKERKIRDVNDAAAALIGRPRKDIIGKMCHEFIYPAAENDCPIHDRGRTVDHREVILLSKDRGDIPIDKTATQIAIDGEPVLLEMFYDITRRKAAETALRESEEKYRNIIENIQDVFYRADIEGNLIMTSRSGAKLLGYDSVEEMIGLNVAKTFYAVHEERDEFLKILADKGVVNDYEITLKKTDGTLVPVRMSSHFYFDKNGNPLGVEGVLSDITERKAAENALRESEERMRTMFEEAPLGIALIDSLTAHIYEVNPQFAKIVGRSKEEMATIDWISITHPDDVQEDLDNMAMLNAGKITGFDMNKRYIQPDGSFVWINMTIAPLKVEDKTQPRHLCMIEDITKRKAAEKAISESEEKLRMITASANDAILMMDPEGNISYWNKAAERMFDYTEEEVIGKNLHALLVPERFHPAFSKGFEVFRETGQGDALGKTLEVAAIGKDGTEFPVELSLSGVKLKGRWNAIGLIRDIAERKAAEEELKKRADELEKFNRLAVGRELKMIELKKEINALLGESGKEPGYKIVGEP